MFGIGETELVIIALFAFLLFGPDKLPSLGRTLGRALRQFREAEEGITEVVRAEIVDPVKEAMDAVSDTPASGAGTTETAAPVVDINAELDADADIPEGPRESFAERRARLEAERRAAAESSAEISLEDAKEKANNPELGGDSESSKNKTDEKWLEEELLRQEEDTSSQAESLLPKQTAGHEGGDFEEGDEVGQNSSAEGSDTSQNLSFQPKSGEKNDLDENTAPEGNKNAKAETDATPARISAADLYKLTTAVPASESNGEGVGEQQD